MEEEVRICDCCGREIADGEETIVENDVLCQSCVEDYCIACDHCGDMIYTENCITDDHTWLCQECYDDYYHRCENCDRIINDDDTCWRNDFPYCSYCYDELDSDDEIEEYNYKPDPIFYGEGKLFLGVELEVDEGGKDGDNARRIKDIANRYDETIYIKADGSINDGFEIVSHPMTLAYHMGAMDWEDILHESVRLDYLSHQTSTCGLHIHVNRSAFGDTEDEQEEIISKILYFVEKHWNELFKFSRRRKSSMNRWSARYGFEKTGREILDKAKSGSNGRYVAVNLNNYHTIEFRLFRGTLKYNTFIATLQLVNEICNVALLLSEEEIEEQSWNDFVAGIVHKELIQYLKERKLYINDEVTAEEEM
ncbi:MAG: amidoligase family protein [Oscillospiraceae bacterium]